MADRETPRGESIDLPPPPGPDFLDITPQPVSSEPYAIERPDLERIREIVSPVFDGARYETLGVSLVETKRGPGVRALFVAYRYDESVPVEVLLDVDNEQVLDVSARAYMPDLSQAERERAINLARDDPSIARLPDLADLEARTLAWEPDPDSEMERGRYAQVAFLGAAERLPRAAVLVDLKTDRVVRSDLMREEQP
jgi:hypothetical protein